MSEENEFLSTLDEGLRDDTALAPFKDVNGLAKSYAELSRTMGKPRVDLPDDSWDEVKWNDHYTKLGRPETAEGYAKDMALPEGVELNAEEAKWASELFHKNGISDKAGKDLLSQYVARQVEQESAREAAKTQSAADTEASLREEWGESYDGKLDMIKGLLTKFDNDSGFMESLNSSELGNNAQFTKFLAGLAEEFKEDIVTGAAGAPVVNGVTRAKMELESMKTDPDKSRLLNSAAYTLSEGERITQKSLLAQRSNLYKLAFPEG